MFARMLKIWVAGLFAACLFSAGSIASAAPICPVPREVTQPDGTVLTVTSYGDEFFSWTENEDGAVIAYDEETGSYQYAKIEDGGLKPTGELAGQLTETASLLSRASGRLQREDIIPLWENAERYDYSKPDDNRVQLASADGAAAPPSQSGTKKLLTILVEFNDIKLKYDGAYWAKQMYSTNPKDISVVNYWKENANGVDVFEPSDTSTVPDGISGTVNDENLGVVGYTLTQCPDGVVKITLDMPHPIRTWSDNHSSAALGDIEYVSTAALDPYYDFVGQKPYFVFIVAGYNVPYGEGKGQVSAQASIAPITTPDGHLINKATIQGELFYNDIPAGIGFTCHELGHSVFSLTDLYFGRFPNGGWTGNGMMYCSLMAMGCWGRLYYWDEPSVHNIWNDPYANQMYHVPTHLDPWCKILCGFVTPTIVNEWDGDINSISPNGVDSQYNVIEVRSKAAPNQYFLIENRQLIGYDSGLEQWNEGRWFEDHFEGGILIYHIDEDVHFNWNNNSWYHHFIMAEHTIDNGENFTWEFLNVDGRNKLNGETTPSTNLHELKTNGNWSCSLWDDCHPQTLKSGISIEVLGDNGPSVRVAANVDEEYQVSMVEGATYADIFPDVNFCRAIRDIMEQKDGIAREPDSVMSIRDWAILTGTNTLDISDYGIKDLTGIQYFQVLDELICNNNEITKMDSTLFPRLSALECRGNQMTELDVSQWEYLTYLYCDNNLLTELDISSNELMYDLICSDNLLTELDVSNNPGLGFLECSNNKLTGLDLTNNPEIQWLRCYENYMDTETPENSILGLDPLRDGLGPPLSKDDPENWFAYYPQNIAETEHSWDTGVITTAPTCTEKGETTYTCENCGATKTEEIAATGQHTPGAAWVTDETSHWHTCTVCGTALDTASHVYDNDQDAACNVCGAQRTVTPDTSSPIESAFTDPAFLTAVREAIGKTNGEHIYAQDVENITELELINLHIANLEGIEYFTGLKELNCHGNDILALDFSHNPNLEVLDCSRNVDLASLNVSNCPELRKLNCNNTVLESLDLRNNKKLTKLITYESELKALDVSNNPLLEEMVVWGSYLVSLDVSKNTKLISLVCALNDMCSVESVTGLENCPALTEDNFWFHPQNTSAPGHVWDGGTVTINPGCTEKGEMTYTCTKCGMTKTEELAATGQHTPGAAWVTDVVGHWHTCTVCGTALDTANHVYDNDQDAACNVCGAQGAVTPDAASPIESAFTDPAFLTAVRKIIGKTNGRHIYAQDVEGITKLELINLHIENLDGIEYFTGLKELYCYDNDILALDFTHNQNLEVLDCSLNVDLASLNVSNCPELRVLDCDNTVLESLDLRNNTKLTTLLTYESELKALDISNNPLLEVMEIWGSYLVSLDVSNNSKLTSLICAYNDMCSAESVTGLENCPALTEENFWFHPQNNPATGHVWDGGTVTTNPGCTEKGETTYTCTKCGMTKTEELAATGQHTPGAAWVTDETSHWHTCTVCGTALDTANHVYDNDQDAACNVCGAPRAVTPDTSSPSGGSSYSYYTITAAAGAGGKIEPSGKVSVRERQNKTFSIIPAEGYVVADLLVDGKSVGAVTEYIFEKVSKAHTIEAVFREAGASDAPDAKVEPCSKDGSCPLWGYADADVAEWYHDGVHYCIENGLMSGYGNDEFGLSDTLTRGMLVQILYNDAGRPTVSGGSSFADVASDAWYGNAVDWAAENNIVAGYGARTFGPDDPITREQLAAVLYRHAGSPAPSALLSSFHDAESAGSYALDALRWAVETSIMSGKGDGILDPKGMTTRAEAAAMLQRYLTLDG